MYKPEDFQDAITAELSKRNPLLERLVAQVATQIFEEWLDQAEDLYQYREKDDEPGITWRCDIPRNDPGGPTHRGKLVEIEKIVNIKFPEDLDKLVDYISNHPLKNTKGY